MDKEPIYNLIKELSKAQGKIKALELYSSESEIKRLQKEILAITSKVRNYIQDNYQQLKTN